MLKRLKNIIFLFPFLLFGCNPISEFANAEIEINLKYLERHDQFYDTIPRYFANIKSIKNIGDELFFSDSGAGKIFVTDMDLNYKREFLNFGEGPEEVRAVYKIATNNEEIIVPDYSASKFLLMNKLGDVSKVLSPHFHQISEENFFVKDNKIHFFNRREIGISIIDTKSGQMKLLPISTETLQVESNELIPRISIFPLGENFVLLTHNKIPLVTLVDKEGKLLAIENFKTDTYFSASIRRQNELSAEGPSSTVTFFNGGEIFNDKLFVIAGYRDGEGTVRFNDLFVISFKNEKIKLNQKITLEASNWYNNFCIVPQNGKFYFFDSANANKYIDVYELQ